MKSTGSSRRESDARSRRATGPGSGSKQNQVYQSLRQRILTGGILPGRPVTLRGIAQQLRVSVMPVREAVRRLIAERALEMRDNRRVCVPAMTPGKFDEIVFARCHLEPELALRALSRMDDTAMAEIDAIDVAMEQARIAGDVENYMRGNLDFHFAIYRLSGAETLLALTESIWLQFTPFMRLAYGRFGTADLRPRHPGVRQAIRSGKGKALSEAIRVDILNGMRLTGELAFAGTEMVQPAHSELGPKRKSKP